MNKRKVGSWYETLACEYLKESGAIILNRNFRARNGEIDIIAKDGNYTCFIEVKYRKDEEYGGPEAAVNMSKQRQICRVSGYYLLKKGFSSDIAIRYDVVAISGNEGTYKIKWHKNAFDYCL